MARLSLVLVVLGASCGGKAIMDDGSGGSGGTSSNSSSSSTGTTVTTTTTTSSPCVSCGEAIQNEVGPGSLCPSAVQKLEALQQCVCAQGNCEVECQEVCDGGDEDPPPPCYDCIVNTCAEEFQACLND